MRATAEARIWPLLLSIERSAAEFIIGKNFPYCESAVKLKFSDPITAGFPSRGGLYCGQNVLGEVAAVPEIRGPFTASSSKSKF